MDTPKENQYTEEELLALAKNGDVKAQYHLGKALSNIDTARDDYSLTLRLKKYAGNGNTDAKKTLDTIDIPESRHRLQTFIVLCILILILILYFSFPIMKQYFRGLKGKTIEERLSDEAVRILNSTPKNDSDRKVISFSMSYSNALSGDVNAQIELAHLFRSGIPSYMDYNDERAVYWLSRAAEQGSVSAMHELGDIYAGDEHESERSTEHGISVQRDYSQSMKYYRRASEKGYLPSTVKIAEMYEYGLFTGGGGG